MPNNPKYVTVNISFNSNPIIWLVSDDGTKLVAVACSNTNYTKPSFENLWRLQETFTDYNACYTSHGKKIKHIKRVRSEVINADNRFSNKPIFNRTTLIIEDYEGLKEIKNQKRELRFVPTEVFKGKDFTLNTPANFYGPLSNNNNATMPTSNNNNNATIMPISNNNNNVTRPATNNNRILDLNCSQFRNWQEPAHYYQDFLSRPNTLLPKIIFVRFSMLDQRFLFYPEKLPMTPSDNVFMILNSMFSPGPVSGEEIFISLTNKISEDLGRTEDRRVLNDQEKQIFLNKLANQRIRSFKAIDDLGSVTNKAVLRLPYHLLFKLGDGAFYSVVRYAFIRPSQPTIFFEPPIVRNNTAAMQQRVEAPPVQVLNKSVQDYYMNQIELDLSTILEILFPCLAYDLVVMSTETKHESNKIYLVEINEEALVYEMLNSMGKIQKSAISLNQLPEEFPHALDEVVKSKKAWLPILLTHLSKAEHIFLYSKKLPDDAYDDNLLNYKKLLERFLAQNLCPLRMIKSEFIKDVFLKRCEAEGEELAAIPSKETVEKEKVEKSNMIENLKNFYRDNKYADIVGDQYTIACVIDELWNKGIPFDALKQLLKNNLEYLENCVSSIDQLYGYAQGKHDNIKNLQPDAVPLALIGFMHTVFSDIKNQLSTCQHKESNDKVNSRLDEMENRLSQMENHLSRLETALHSQNAHLFYLLQQQEGILSDSYIPSPYSPDREEQSEVEHTSAFNMTFFNNGEKKRKFTPSDSEDEHDINLAESHEPQQNDTIAIGSGLPRPNTQHAS